MRDWGRGERQVTAKMEEEIYNSTRLERSGQGSEVNDMHTGFEARWPTEIETVRVAVSQWKGSCKSGRTTAEWSPLTRASLLAPSELFV